MSGVDRRLWVRGRCTDEIGQNPAGSGSALQYQPQGKMCGADDADYLRRGAVSYCGTKCMYDEKAF